MTVKLNKKALDHAKKLIKGGKAVHDERDDWSEHAPSTQDENAFIEKHGFADYSVWHLGVDEDKSEETKGRYSFPYGDFTRTHRCAVISGESRAAQNDHEDIKKATQELLSLLDKD